MASYHTAYSQVLWLLLYLYLCFYFMNYLWSFSSLKYNRFQCSSCISVGVSFPMSLLFSGFKMIHLSVFMFGGLFTTFLVTDVDNSLLCCALILTLILINLYRIYGFSILVGVMTLIFREVCICVYFRQPSCRCILLLFQLFLQQLLLKIMSDWFQK